MPSITTAGRSASAGAKAREPRRRAQTFRRGSSGASAATRTDTHARATDGLLQEGSFLRGDGVPQCAEASGHCFSNGYTGAP